jgi:hypothetical membrane protein
MRVPARPLLHLVTTTVLAVCVVVQVFLAGLGVFDDPATFLTHAGFGYLIELITIVVIVTALVARAGRRQVGLAVLSFLLLLMQSVFVALRDAMPAVAGLHPVNVFLILLVSIVMARAAWAPARAASVGSPDAAAPATVPA